MLFHCVRNGQVPGKTGAGKEERSTKEGLRDIDNYIKEHYRPEWNAQMRVREAVCPYEAGGLGDRLDNMEETFSEMLLRIIDEKGKKDPDVYKGAHMDRKLFSKIRSNRNYNPKKTTVLALAVSLELSLEETNELLSSAGYALSMGQKSDVIMRYFLERQEYDLFLINETLLHFGQTLLGTAAK